MRESMQFTYDGVSSEDMGVRIISSGSGLFQETFLPNRTIIETKAAQREKPYFQRVESAPLSFSLSIFIEEWAARDNLRQIARWLFQDYYKPLFFDSNPERIYYAIVEGDSTLTHNGAREGYINLEFRCDSPYTYSPLQHMRDIQVRGSSSLVVHNDGDLPIKFTVSLTKKLPLGDVSIGLLGKGEKMTIKNLQNNEEILIDSENEELISDLQVLNIFRYEDHNGVWLELPVGVSTFDFTGNFDAQIEYEMRYLAD